MVEARERVFEIDRELTESGANEALSKEIEPENTVDVIVMRSVCEDGLLEPRHLIRWMEKAVSLSADSKGFSRCLKEAVREHESLFSEVMNVAKSELADLIDQLEGESRKLKEDVFLKREEELTAKESLLSRYEEIFEEVKTSTPVFDC